MRASLPLSLFVSLGWILGCVLVGVAACGRSAEPLFACPQPSDECAELLSDQAAVEVAYADAALALDAALMDESSQCAQLFVEQSLDQQCVEACAELCRLHPCVIVDDEGGRFDPSTCVARCDELVKEGAVVAADLDAATVKAAENPGFCSCRACTAQDDALCTRLFDCAVAP